MRIKNQLLTSSLVLASLMTSAQNKYKSLHIGDQMPDIVLHNMVNYPGGKARFSDFKGKLVILDFWNMGCSPCISAFPKMQKMQKEFEGKIQILLVNVIDKPERLKNAGFPKNTSSPIIPKIELPFVLHCKELEALFPHAAEPYHVWVDGQGKIVSTTTANGTSPQHISDFLAGKKYNCLYN
jgi:thiol-disulfide isomerase/thioredoxin